MIIFKLLSFCEVSLGGGISVSMSAMYNVLFDNRGHIC